LIFVIKVVSQKLFSANQNILTIKRKNTPYECFTWNMGSEVRGRLSAYVSRETMPVFK
jgi:hypothetical protein